ncbi:DUF1016 N-terminal domain-containing protein [Arthrobacter bambusae]|uniref:DUF1016 N-terminal domain-containing protein n=1 Tax=Arthrobacter bambusae TaxID=1338426 RepID=UPI00278AE15A|nr:DUF1016 N-terminal domain-containing protein [Arthrobacter bambusae]MDQ0242150.1 hypothetical protein [Arthrobacter bambusae]
MTTFAKAWAGSPIAQQLVSQLPLGYFTVLLDKISLQEDRDWHASAPVEYGWSRNMLLTMIMNKTLARAGAVPSDFAQPLVARDSEDTRNSPGVGPGFSSVGRKVQFDADGDDFFVIRPEPGPGYVGFGFGIHQSVGTDREPPWRSNRRVLRRSYHDRSERPAVPSNLCPSPTHRNGCLGLPSVLLLLDLVSGCG